MEWYQAAEEKLRDLRRLQEEKGSVDGPAFLKRFFITGDGPEEVDGDSSEEELTLAMRANIEGFEDWLNEHCSDFVKVTQDSWTFDIEDTFTSEDNLNEHENRLSETLTEPEISLLDKIKDGSISSEAHIDTIKNIYHKIKSSQKSEKLVKESAFTSRLMALHVKDSEDDNEKATWFRNAAEAGLKVSDQETPSWFNKAAESEHRLINHARSSDLYHRAITALENESIIKKLNLTSQQVLKKKLALAAKRKYRAYESGDRDKISKAILQESEYQFKDSKGLEWLTRGLFKVTSNHGESPSWVVYLSVLVVVLCACFYSIFEIFPTDKSYTKTCLTHIYFSFVTFTTLGYGDFVPISLGSRIVAGTEAVLGLLLTSFFLASFLRKYSR